MSTLLVLLMVILILLTKRFRREAVRTPVFARQYTHPGHMWLRQTGDGEVTVGIDTLAAGVLGLVDGVRFPRYLKKLHQGEPCCTLQHGSREITLTCPISGWVVEKNEMVRFHPSLVTTSPHGEGWLFRIHPTNLAIELRNLLSGKRAEAWADMGRSHLLRLFGPTPIFLSQDGGKLIENFSQHCSDADWLELKRDLFLDEVPEAKACLTHVARKEGR
ncbi:MAG: hypothetical protein OEV30_02435 [Ignavibacteria bacterium]|nr:hypothetical protein [Ignavibacteria bacterium]